MWAARIRLADGTLDERCNDDGENGTHSSQYCCLTSLGAGQNLISLLQNMSAENVVVVVSRWFGGIMLGSDRFRHVCSATPCYYLADIS